MDEALDRVIRAATLVDPTQRPSAAQLRELLRDAGLSALGPGPTDPVEVVDEFAAIRGLATGPMQPTVASGGTPRLPPLPPPPPPPAPRSTRPEPPAAHPVAPRPSRVPAYLLLLLGVVGLVVAGWLLLG